MWLVSDPEYSGYSACFYKRSLWYRWEMVRILQIFGLFPWLVIEIAVSVVDFPDYLGYSSAR